MNDKKIYEPIDIEGLATALAEDAWKEEVKAKGLTIDELYETRMEIIPCIPQNELVEKKTVRPHWAYNFFALRDGYLSLINKFKPMKL